MSPLSHTHWSQATVSKLWNILLRRHVIFRGRFLITYKAEWPEDEEYKAELVKG